MDWWCLTKQADRCFSKGKKSIFKRMPHCLAGARPCPSHSFLGTQALWEKTQVPIPISFPISPQKQIERIDRINICFNVTVAFPLCVEGPLVTVVSFGISSLWR